MAEIILARLRKAREYIGLSVAQASGHLGWMPELLEDIEGGTLRPGPEALARLGKLYMRPAEWFRGEFKFEPGPGITRMLEGVKDPGDREGILDFAEFLACKKQTDSPKPRSFTHFPPESGMDDQAAEDNGIIG